MKEFLESELVEIINKYKIEYDGIERVVKNVFRIRIGSRNVIARMCEDKGKIAWQYKTLLSLKGKVSVPDVFMVDGSYVLECIMFYEPSGKSIQTYEEKEAISGKLGEYLANLHISELNEQRSEEELKKLWNKYILNSALIETTNLNSCVNQKGYDEILNFLTENLKVLSNDFEIALIAGKLRNEEIYFDKEIKRLTLTNFEDSMLGDAAIDFASVYSFLNFNNEFIQNFVDGYESIMSVPEGFEEKLNIFLVLNFINAINTLDINDAKDKIDEYIKKIQDIILSTKNNA